MTTVLITNDDGVASRAIPYLASAMSSAGMKVLVAVPSYEASGASAALSAVYTDRRLAIEPVEVAGSDIPAYSVQASPSYIVVLAYLGTFGPKPDVVVSGINRGANAGYAILHSGTVGAALTAANHGLRALAVSLDVLSAVDADPATGGASLTETLDALDNESLHWQTAAHLAHVLIRQIAELPEGTIVNLNVPNRSLEDLAGVRVATLAPFGQVTMSLAESGEGYVRTAIKQNSDRYEEGSDIALLAEGYATVTPVRSIRAVEDTKLGALIGSLELH